MASGLPGATPSSASGSAGSAAWLFASMLFPPPAAFSMLLAVIGASLLVLPSRKARRRLCLTDEQ